MAATAEFEFNHGFGVSAGATFLQGLVLPTLGPSSLVVGLTENSRWSVTRDDTTITHFIAEFSARAEAGVNVTARGVLDLASANVVRLALDRLLACLLVLANCCCFALA